ncbi:MAG TPA: hypothetical protein VFG54_09130 [Prolixibacteraceae bacterium]|nr:hypothetical protein [Prolixibacteraceae bacterium]
MRIQWALLCVVATSLAGFSQDKNFDLSKYTFPDYKRHEIELNFNSEVRGNDYYYETPFRSDDPGIMKVDQKNFYSNSDAALVYTYEKHTRKHIDLLYSSLSGLHHYSKYNNTQEKRKTYEFEGSWNFSGSSRFYLTRDKLFVEGLSTMWFSYSDSKRTNEPVGQNSMTDKRKSNTLSLSAGLGIGIGRLEKVNDFWQTYYILEKLNGQKSLRRELEEKDVFEFATLASILKNERFFDARLRKIAELKALDSLLKSQGLIENGDIAYFTTLNDYWSYGNFPERRSGGELKVQVMPEYTSNYWKNDELPSTTSSHTNLVSKIQFEHAKQLNLYWERTFSLMASNSSRLATDEELPDDYPSNLLRTEARAGFGFYPNSRTSLKVEGSYSGYEHARTETDQTEKKWNHALFLGLNSNYYISPQLQLTASMSGAYDFSEYHSMEYKSMYYEVGLRYAVF